MMQMKKVSLIIPVYNTEKYLERCIQSACEQSYSNMEVICVDDGSTDQSGQILDNFTKKYECLTVIHQKNQGESAARNTGLKHASGDYIGFMDCDDWIEPNMYETLVEYAENERLDMVACGYSLEYETERKIPVNEAYVSTEVFGRKQLFEYVYIRDRYRAVTSWVWCKLFRRELIFCEDKTIEFDENVRFGADLYFFIQAAAKVKRAYYISEPFYHYLQRNSSTSHTQRLEVAFEIIPIYERMIDFCSSKQIEEEIIPWLQRFMAYRATLVAEQAYEQKNKQYLIMCQKIMCKLEKVYIETNKEFPERLKRYENILNYKIYEEK